MSSDQRRYFAGIDWASRSHHVRVIDADGVDLGEEVFRHDGEGLSAMADWLLQLTGVSAAEVHIAIEVPHGPLVEFLLDRGFAVFAINPKQLDRFRDRFSPAGAKDDSLDCLVLGSALRTDAHCFRKVELPEPAIVELRECSRLREELVADRTALTNRFRDQLWRYFPALLQLDEELSAGWILELWNAAPTPQKAARIRKITVETILKRHRIRRLDADQVIQVLRQKPIQVLPATITAARDRIASLVPRIRLLNEQIKQAEHSMRTLIETLSKTEETEPGQPVEQRDATILSSWPGLGKIGVTTLLAEAWQSLRDGNYHALRCICGVAPVTKQSGKQRLVVRRLAFNPRLANAVYHWARTAVQHDPASKAKYAALRARGCGHARALRSVADHLLRVLCAMLRTRTLFSPRQAQNTA